MCFSANASFTTSALLLLCSIVTLKRATLKQRMLAAIPLLFAIQQFCEGLVWRGFSHDMYPAMAIYSYLFFVHIVWPLWVPFSIRYAATKKSEKKAVQIPIIAGILLAIMSVGLLTMQPVTARIEHYHIYYVVPVPNWLIAPSSILYLIATLVPFFIVKIRYFKLMGLTLGTAYIMSLIFFYHYHLSVWCFFAALVSIFMFLVLG